jgi:hypothetical protein
MENEVTNHANRIIRREGKSPTAYDTSEGSPLVRFSIDKQFSGDPAATSIGEMLAAGTAAHGSGVYVAVSVSGTLAGRAGSFVLHHTAS